MSWWKFHPRAGREKGILARGTRNEGTRSIPTNARSVVKGLKKVKSSSGWGAMIALGGSACNAQMDHRRELLVLQFT